MRPGRLKVLTIVALSATIATCPGCRASQELPGVASEHPAAVVLLAGPNRLLTVDLTERRIVAEAGLRSFAYDLAVDDAGGRVITAQCGGVANDADDAVAVYDVRRGGRVRYLRLPCANPCLVACVRGRSFVQHGVVTASRLRMTVVDPRGLRVLGSGSLPDGPGAWLLAAGDRLLMLRSSDTATSGPSSARREAASGPVLRLARFDPGTSSCDDLGPVPRDTSAAVVDSDGDAVLFGGAGEGTWMAELRERPRALLPRRIAGIDGVGSACLTDRLAVVAEAESPSGEVRARLAFVEREGGRTLGTLTIPEGILSLAAWGEHVLMVTRRPCRLSAVDPATRRTLWSIDLAKERVVAADIGTLPPLLR